MGLNRADFAVNAQEGRRVLHDIASLTAGAADLDAYVVKAPSGSLDWSMSAVADKDFAVTRFMGLPVQYDDEASSVQVVRRAAA